MREKADLFIAHTQRAKEALLIEGVEEERMRLIPMGIDLRVKEKFDHLKIAEELKQVYQRLL